MNDERAHEAAHDSADEETDDAAVRRSSASPSKSPPLRYRTLYFIRHGEAQHNILEREARAKAKADAVAAGYAEDSDETKRRMEQARMDILNNESLLDAPLSSAGMREAEDARDVISRLINNGDESDLNLPPPTEVLVSPLQRALQTAAIVFPRHDNVRVREEVRERLTGKACDSRVSTFKMQRRDTFKNFSMSRQMRNSFRRRARLVPGRIAERTGLRTLKEAMSTTRSGGSSFFRKSQSKSKRGLDVDGSKAKGDGAVTVNDDGGNSGSKTLSSTAVEDKCMLRERTRKLFDLIAESRHDHIAVVTHKGFLRELERGPFGQEGASEFANCEVRVYRAGFVGRSTELQAVERIA